MPSTCTRSHRAPGSAARQRGTVRSESPFQTVSRPGKRACRMRTAPMLHVWSKRSNECTRAVGLLESQMAVLWPALKPTSQIVRTAGLAATRA